MKLAKCRRNAPMLVNVKHGFVGCAGFKVNNRGQVLALKNEYREHGGGLDSWQELLVLRSTDRPGLMQGVYSIHSGDFRYNYADAVNDVVNSLQVSRDWLPIVPADKLNSFPAADPRETDRGGQLHWCKTPDEFNVTAGAKLKVSYKSWLFATDCSRRRNGRYPCRFHLEMLTDWTPDLFTAIEALTAATHRASKWSEKKLVGGRDLDTLKPNGVTWLTTARFTYNPMVVFKPRPCKSRPPEKVSNDNSVAYREAAF